MTSKIKVDNINKVSDDSNIINKCGTAINVGASGNTVTVTGNDIRSDSYKASDGGVIISQSGTTVTIGASGAVMAILFAYGYLYPNRTLLFYLVPMKAKYCILILIITELSQELLRNPSDNVSHVGHLGGMFIGYLYLRFGKQIIFFSYNSEFLLDEIFWVKIFSQLL